MALDHQIRIARDHFGISGPEDWADVRPEWILQLYGCGQQTLDHIRLYLAARGLTLKDDATPTYWQQHIQSAQMGTQIAKSDRSRVEPYTVLIDSQEKQPFTFQGFTTKGRPRIVPTEWKTLGPTHGDYSVKGLERDAHVERKSREDAHGTFLSHGERRERWNRTLLFLAEIPCSAVVVECSFEELIGSVQARGKRSKEVLQKTIHRQVVAWAQDLRIPFHFCGSRRLAEATTLAILERRWKEVNGLKRKAADAENQEIIATL